MRRILVSLLGIMRKTGLAEPSSWCSAHSTRGLFPNRLGPREKAFPPPRRRLPEKMQPSGRRTGTAPPLLFLPKSMMEIMLWQFGFAGKVRWLVLARRLH